MSQTLANNHGGSYSSYKTEQNIQYHTPQVYTFIDLIDMNKIDWKCFCANPNAILFFDKYPEKFKELDEKGIINWSWLSSNPGAIPLLEKNIDKIRWDLLSMNPEAIPLLEANLDKIYWYNLCQNEKGIPFIEKYYNIKYNYPYHENSFPMIQSFTPFYISNADFSSYKIYNTFYYIFQNSGMFRSFN